MKAPWFNAALCSCVLQTIYECVIWNIHMYGSTFMHVHNAKPMRNNERIHPATKINTATCSSRHFRWNCWQPHTVHTLHVAGNSLCHAGAGHRARSWFCPCSSNIFSSILHCRTPASRNFIRKKSSITCTSSYWLSWDHCLAFCRARNSALGSIGTHIHRELDTFPST